MKSQSPSRRGNSLAGALTGNAAAPAPVPEVRDLETLLSWSSAKPGRYVSMAAAADGLLCAVRMRSENTTIDVVVNRDDVWSTIFFASKLLELTEKKP